MMAQRSIVCSATTCGERERLSRERRLRRAALQVLCDPAPPVCLEELTGLSAGAWKRLLRWLHLSGLALRFSDRLQELRRNELLPGWAIARLAQDQNDNRERTQGMLAESIAIQSQFQQSGVRYSVLKGLSLWPYAVSLPELRLQFDLDFLVAETDVAEARKILEARGYRAYAVNLRSGELQFKRNEKPGLALKDVYRNTGSWAVELHVEGSSAARPLLEKRLQWRNICGFSMPVLPPVDLLLAQGMHAYKHVCCPFPRASFLVEFRSHVLYRIDDGAFWNAFCARLEEAAAARMGLGIVTLLISKIMGDFAPEEMMLQTVDRVPRVAQVWCREYGSEIVLGSYPGSKLFLLLRHALGEPADVTGAGRSMGRVLLPLRVPPPPIRAISGETMAVRMGRYRMHLALLFGRLRFHIAEGLRLWWEWRVWRQTIRSLQ